MYLPRPNRVNIFPSRERPVSSCQGGGILPLVTVYRIQVSKARATGLIGISPSLDGGEGEGSCLGQYSNRSLKVLVSLDTL
jgi:hypothetical protein